MADLTTTLAAVLNLGDANVDFEVSDLLQATPVLNAMAAVPSSHGHNHKYIKETIAAGSGFRAVDAGITNAGATVDLQTITLQFLDASLERDIALVKAFEGGETAFISGEIRRSLAAALAGVESQIFYGTGTGGDAAGFTGILNELDALADDTVIDAGGVAADVQTSVYAVTTGPTSSAIVYNGQDSGTLDVSDGYKVRTEDGSNDPYTLMRVDICGYLGLQLGNKWQLGRLANVDATATLDDDMLADLLGAMPMRPNFLAMSRQSRTQLQKSRTATTTSGAAVPLPSDYDGIPIIVSEHILNTEAVEV